LEPESWTSGAWLQPKAWAASLRQWQSSAFCLDGQNNLRRVEMLTMLQSLGQRVLVLLVRLQVLGLFRDDLSLVEVVRRGGDLSEGVFDGAHLRTRSFRVFDALGGSCHPTLVLALEVVGQVLPVRMGIFGLEASGALAIIASRRSRNGHV
jgi:hypothetical protein